MGEFFSILCSVFWAGAIIFYRLAGEKFPPKLLNLYKNLISTSLFVLVCLFVGEKLIPNGFEWIDLILLGVSGFLGITLSDTFLFMSINRIGASLIGIIEAVYLPFVFLLSAVFFGENIEYRVYLGASLIVLAIVISSIDFEQSKHLPIKDLMYGIMYGVLAMFFTAFSIVMIKKPFIVEYSVLEKYSALWSTTARMSLALCFLILMYFFGSEKNFFGRMKQRSFWHHVVPGSISGGFLSMGIWIIGMKLITRVSVGAVLNQLAVVFIIVFAALFLREKITIKKAFSLILAVIGGLIVIL